jgi:hypothetical protein
MELMEMTDIEGSEPDWHLVAMVAMSERGKRASFTKKCRALCRGNSRRRNGKRISCLILP